MFHSHLTVIVSCHVLIAMFILDTHVRLMTYVKSIMCNPYSKIYFKFVWCMCYPISGFFSEDSKFCGFPIHFPKLNLQRPVKFCSLNNHLYSILKLCVYCFHAFYVIFFFRR